MCCVFVHAQYSVYCTDNNINNINNEKNYYSLELTIIQRSNSFISNVISF